MIDDDLLRMLMTGLIKNTTITYLDMSHNKITNHGARLLSKLLGMYVIVWVMVWLCVAFIYYIIFPYTYPYLYPYTYTLHMHATYTHTCVHA
ncbi:hypothetical protein EON63_16270 [archaeon]|nr:MAG: hypothetical protein EON63_16270 [archaeon]